MNYLTLEIFQKDPQLLKIDNQIISQACKEVLNFDLKFDKTWIEQNIVDELDLISIIIWIEDTLGIYIPDEVANQFFVLDKNPPNFKLTTRINNLNTLLQ